LKATWAGFIAQYVGFVNKKYTICSIIGHFRVAILPGGVFAGFGCDRFFANFTLLADAKAAEDRRNPRRWRAVPQRLVRLYQPVALAVTLFAMLLFPCEHHYGKAIA
jgi:hypothetical protein